VHLREIGAVVGILLVAALMGPLVPMGLIGSGRIGVAQGLIASAGLALILCLSTRSFLIVSSESPRTRRQERPRLVGATIVGSMVYSLVAFLAGILIRG
jgi:hypothetical protein